tara:strand:- start:420 stop:680 length:261 start_codon:yes stop_codon:yes gene_type:complete
MPRDIVPQLAHVLIFDLKEFKPINIKNNSKSGISKKSNNMFPRKPNKKLIPKIGITRRMINDEVRNVLFILRKLFIIPNISFTFFY